MLRVTIELVPHGDESKAEVLQVTHIINDLTGNDEHGNYIIVAEDYEQGPFAHVYRHGRFQPGALATLAYRALVQRASILKEKVPQ